MTSLPDRLVVRTTPLARENAVVIGDRYRITVLSQRLFRLEYSPTGTFEDRATQMVVNRDFEVPEFQVMPNGDGVRIHTPYVQLVYDGQEFSPGGLRADLVGGFRHGRTWRYGVTDLLIGGVPANLGGTARTLDEVDGPTPLEDGVASRSGTAMIDDSTTMALTSDGWVAPRIEGNTDLYLFAHGDDFRGALADFYALTGPQPMLPRYALGNWWSRYHPYSADEYTQLIERFERENLPFSVAVIDMDWHLVDIPAQYGTGWTGYTWNRELFPDPQAFLAWLHEHGLKVSLNVHPADGIRAHEEFYPAMAAAMGIDPDSELAVNFDIADTKFLVNYLEQVHHPLEEQGVDFWWLDWQQGTYTSVKGLDPLWMLNHFHFLDSARRGERPITFSRYAGPGSHRYPVGFSGDTINTWESLDFQPKFTAAATNIGYGWWSHDIGGHWQGYRDDEMVTRWFQLGTFSPLNRLHSTFNAFMGKEPWRYNGLSERIMGDFLRLRHRMVPYLYTMNERSARLGEPLVQPLYYGSPGSEATPAALSPYAEVFGSPNTYYFGTELLVVPITAPADRRLGLASVKTWLPDGIWRDWFTGLAYRGGRVVRLHRPLNEYPVLAKAGAIVPLTAPDELGIGNPSGFELHVFAGADGAFEIYEDDDAAVPRAVRTRITWDDAAGELIVHAAGGELDVVPAARRYTVRIHGLDGALPAGGEPVLSSADEDLLVDLGTVSTETGTTLRLAPGWRPAGNEVTQRVFDLLNHAQIEYATKDAVWEAITRPGTVTDRITALHGLELEPQLEAVLHELLLAGG